MATIYPTLIGKIQSTLEKSSKIKQIFAYPAQRIEKYPCAIFFPFSFDNDFDTTNENFKIYRFKIWLVANAQQKNLPALYSSVMPKLVDDVLAKFDEDWDFGSIEGHQAWSKISTGAWTLSNEKNGVELSAELDLEIKILTNN